MPQFWFIPMICIFYLISPVLRYIDYHPRWYVIIPVLLLVSFIVDRPDLNNNSLQLFLYFLPIYLLGMHTSHYIKTYLNLLKKYWIVVLVIVVVFTGLTFTSDKIGYFQKVAFTFLVLYFFYKVSNTILDHVLGLVAKYSFGIFFIHKYAIILVTLTYVKLSVDHIMNAGVIGLTFTFVLITYMCIILLMPIKHVFKKNSRLICGS